MSNFELLIVIWGITDVITKALILVILFTSAIEESDGGR